MLTLVLFVVGAAMILAAVIVSFRLSHRSSGRSDLTQDLGRLLAEVDRALMDPVLIQQARRRVWGRHSHDG
jgi:hypothetical protein